jgi:anti-sigma factor RsiW
MTCRELVELVTDYLEDRLEEGDRRRFDEHLRECPDCREYVEQMRQTVRGLGALSEDALSAPARDALLHAFQAWRS